MADADKKDQDDQEQLSPPKSRLPLILGAAVVLAGAGAGGYMFLGGGQKKADKPPPDAVGKMGPLVPIDPMIVNLDEPGGNRYLKIAFDLELKRDLDEPAKALMPRLRDQVLLYLSSLSVEQVKKNETKLAMKKKIKDTANEVFGQRLAKAVYFKELVMQ